jgi:hypothetical protein
MGLRGSDRDRGGEFDLFRGGRGHSERQERVVAIFQRDQSVEAGLLGGARGVGHAAEVLLGQGSQHAHVAIS